MTTLFHLLERLKKELQPHPRIAKIATEVAMRIQKEVQKRGIDATVVVGGSVAKNTHLAQDSDIDLFVRFVPTYADRPISDLLEGCMKVFKPRRLHGSRDYFQFEYEECTIEVVPVIQIINTQMARNVTDASPLHVAYFTQHGKQLVDEVRLVKQFCKSARVYGAESYLRGFSGHVIDLLVLKYQSFYELVKSAAHWKAPVVIDLAGHHTNPLTEMDPAKLGPLVIVDPIQPERNAAAALSEENFVAFTLRCKEFLRAPDKSFFSVVDFQKDRLLYALASRPYYSLVLSVSHDAEMKKDVAGGRIRKLYERSLSQLDQCKFTVVDADWNFSYEGLSTIYFSVEEHSLPRLEDHEGPPVTNENAVKAFQEAHPECEEKDGRLHTKREREFTQANQVLAYVLETFPHQDIHAELEVLGGNEE